MNIPGVGAAPSLEQVEDMIRTAASIKDPDIALECTNVVLDATRIGMRSDTSAHQKPSWAEPATDRLNIPYTETCAEPCSACRASAATRAKNSDDLSIADWEDRMWVGKSQATSRPFPLYWTYRLMTTKYRWYCRLQQKRGDFSRPVMNRMTVWRRYRKVAELTPTIKNPEVHNPRGGRAAAGMYWVQVLGVKAATPLMAWVHASTADYYLRHSLAATERAMARVRNTGRVFPVWALTNKPPYSEIRPDDPDELIELDSVLPETSVSDDEPHKDDEDKLKEEGLLKEHPTDIAREHAPLVNEHPKDIVENAPVTEFEAKSISDRLQELGESTQTEIDTFLDQDDSHRQRADAFGVLTAARGISNAVRHSVTELTAWARWWAASSREAVRPRILWTLLGVVCLAFTAGILLGEAGVGITILHPTVHGSATEWTLFITVLLISITVGHELPDTNIAI